MGHMLAIVMLDYCLGWVKFIQGIGSHFIKIEIVICVR